MDAVTFSINGTDIFEPTFNKELCDFITAICQLNPGQSKQELANDDRSLVIPNRLTTGKANPSEYREIFERHSLDEIQNQNDAAVVKAALTKAAEKVRDASSEGDCATHASIFISSPNPIELINVLDAPLRSKLTQTIIAEACKPEVPGGGDMTYHLCHASQGKQIVDQYFDQTQRQALIARLNASIERGLPTRYDPAFATEPYAALLLKVCPATEKQQTVVGTWDKLVAASKAQASNPTPLKLQNFFARFTISELNDCYSNLEAEGQDSFRAAFKEFLCQGKEASSSENDQAWDEYIAKLLDGSSGSDTRPISRNVFVFEDKLQELEKPVEQLLENIPTAERLVLQHHKELDLAHGRIRQGTQPLSKDIKDAIYEQIKESLPKNSFADFVCRSLFLAQQEMKTAA